MTFFLSLKLINIRTEKTRYSAEKAYIGFFMEHRSAKIRRRDRVGCIIFRSFPLKQKILFV